jgi:predicted small lipoprotein YifL
MRVLAALVLVVSLVGCGPKAGGNAPPADAAPVIDAGVDAALPIDAGLARGHSGFDSVAGGGAASSESYKIISTTSPSGGAASSASVRTTTGVVGGTQP